MIKAKADGTTMAPIKAIGSRNMLHPHPFGSFQQWVDPR